MSYCQYDKSKLAFQKGSPGRRYPGLQPKGLPKGRWLDSGPGYVLVVDSSASNCGITCRIQPCATSGSGQCIQRNRGFCQTMRTFLQLIQDLELTVAATFAHRHPCHRRRIARSMQRRGAPRSYRYCERPRARTVEGPSLGRQSIYLLRDFGSERFRGECWFSADTISSPAGGTPTARCRTMSRALILRP